ncbi:calcium/sodium antiporter [Mesobacillus subterraneus]|uniref:calcium/sodium antiporter n=1 Tax=Mesobacillus subterraneus TaxID=285983 RepID=UPI00203CFDC9|nr:calcium/sodium antiporter [Mesobacillus subterraneus]MCM3665128.1 calcium/sodium antiporter [Mesobacillus subterraneus]MCM3684141.1 calcium/sodium antiporter [Mesobacillus subterraneus]
MTYVLLIIGFALLIKGADYFVVGASKIAALLRVPPLLVGLTIVAFGTSSPEATVSIIAALEGSSDVSLGNVIGSNIFNITLVVGITALINPLSVETTTIRKEIPFTMLASVALAVLANDIALQAAGTNLINRSDGIILLLFFIIFLYYIIEVAINNREQVPDAAAATAGGTWGKNILFTLAGLAAIIFGGDLVVDNATKIALSIGMSETLVGLTIVAVGTSLPELITSITAALKKESEIALGNIVGSNIFNILFVLGAAATISPLAVNDKIFMDIGALIILTLVLLLFSRTRFKISKVEGVILAVAYISYLVFIILRN